MIFADFGQGLLTPATLDRLIDQLRRRVRIMSGDVSGKRASLLRLRQLDLVCPTEIELREAMSDYAEGWAPSCGAGWCGPACSQRS